MKLFDTHCHLNFKAFAGDVKKIIARTQRANLDILVVGTDLGTCQKAIELAREYDRVYAAVGFHPIHIRDRDWQKELEQILLLARDPQVKAIGETGYDSHYLEEAELESGFRLQDKIFNELIDKASELNKPIILHSRGFLDRLEDRLKSKIEIFKRCGLVLHCYPGGMGLAKWMQENGFYLGFNGLITKSSKWDEVIRQISLDNILLETDAPFLTPLSKGKVRNQPIFIFEVAKHISRLKDISVEEIASKTFQNSQRFLKL
jgi:TatD DNase family protein